jgi:hypothetical protein
MALAINTRTGKTVDVPEHYIGHSVLGKDLKPLGDEVQAAPKKEKKKTEEPAAKWSFAATPKEEQPAPDDTKENEDIEDAN